MDGTTLCEEGWGAWSENALRGTQEFSWMEESCEERPSAHRSWWHRRQLWRMYGMWADQTPLETVLPGRGDAVMEEWAVHGRVSASWWMKHRGEVVEEGVWLDMIEELKQRQRAAEGACRRTSENGGGRRRGGQRRKPWRSGGSRKHIRQRSCWRQTTVSVSRCCIRLMVKGGRAGARARVFDRLCKRARGEALARR